MPSPQAPPPPGDRAPGGGADDAARAGAQSSGSLIEHQPTVLGLARVSRRGGLTPGEQAVYRRIHQLVELEAGQEFLITPCGNGLTARFLAETTGAAGSGLDPDPELIEQATEAAREHGLAQRLHFDPAPSTDLPYQDEVFDLVIGDVGIAASADPAAAVRELARVARPMGAVVLIQPVWNRELDADRRELLIEHLGVRPFLLVEWKQMLRDAGVVELIVEDLTDGPNPWLPLIGVGGTVDFPSVRERLGLLFEAWRQWGWRGLRQAVAGGQELRRLITQERILGLALIKGARWKEGGDVSGRPTGAEA